LKPAQNVVIASVTPDQKQPAVPTPIPEEVSIIDSGADKPEAYIVHNSDGTTHILVDVSENGIDSVITITEKPGAYPEVKVNDELAIVVDIGGPNNNSDIVH
jgi:hypothetical protein